MGRILVDNDSLVNLIYSNYFEKMNISKDCLKPVQSPLFSFTRESVPIIGAVQLAITLGAESQSITRIANFMVVDTSSSAYNVILGCSLLNNMRAIISTRYLLIKFPTDHGIGQVHGDQKKARNCYVSPIKSQTQKETLSIVEQPINKSQLVKKVEAVSLHLDDTYRIVYVGGLLPKKTKKT